MPTPRAGAAVAALGKQILVVGGVGEDQKPLKVVEMYNTEEGRWRKRSALREALMGVSIIVKGKRISEIVSSLFTNVMLLECRLMPQMPVHDEWYDQTINSAK